ncbi:TadE/TadG family type IV pilus assembly protein [Halocynthiibacter sp.]|uniref:TadE/TadG family type IV pilus assembly protein n=1 Tax=Halocynthiibacter sp. TaxID=1979210 RepID=UPI003C4C6F0C
MIHAIRKKIRRFRRDETGNVTVEFVILFPFLFSIMLSIIESGVLMLRQVMLDRAVEISVRELRLGNITNITHEEMKTRICRDAVVLGSCAETILLELRPIDTVTWQPLNRNATCYDRAAEINPPSTLIRGGESELMMVRACVMFSPFFEITGYAMALPRDASGLFGLVATSSFVNEPENDLF